MPRRKAVTTKPPPSKSHKRELSSSANPNTTTTTPGSRQSKRIKASAENTPTTEGRKLKPEKSKYFEGPGSDDGENEDQPEDSTEVQLEGETSGYEDKDASASHASSATPSSASSSEEEAYDSDDAPKKRQKKKQVNTKQTGNGSTKSEPTTGGLIEKGKELWRQGIKAGLGPGKAVFIERPKPRGDGGIKYVPERIHPNTMAFLGDLKANNEREWLKSE